VPNEPFSGGGSGVKGVCSPLQRGERAVANGVIVDARFEEVSSFFATLMTAAARSTDPRLERVFKLVRRHAFLPPGPWQVMVGDAYHWTPSADYIYLYQNLLIALDAEKGINNGEPFLHAQWLGRVAPQPGECVVHIGAGMGYYSALLSVLVSPGGKVSAYELQPHLAVAAITNLSPFGNVTLTSGDAVNTLLPSADIIYVNAGVAVPPLAWLDALQPGGRMIFPWRPSKQIGIAAIIRRSDTGLSFEPFAPAWFIPCIGASEVPDGSSQPTHLGAWQTRSIVRMSDRQPDDTATAVYADIWFSSAMAA
jgi:protein-L-isoaspartate(D-aspartate) O-methyltransferase